MSTSWANMVRRAKGEQLVNIDGKLLTQTKAAQYQKTMAGFDYVMAQVKEQLAIVTPLAAEIRKRKFSLMNLPIEIRQLIFEFAFSDEPRSVMVFPKDTPTNRNLRRPLPLSALARAGDRTLRLEVIKYFFENTDIEVHSGPANEQFRTHLASIDFNLLGGDTNYVVGFDAVKSLSFPFFSRFPHTKLPSSAPNNDVELALTCYNLRTLKLTFVDAELCGQCYEEFFPKQVNQLRQEYRLDGLLELKMLEELKLGLVETNFVLNWAGPIGMDRVAKLAEWFEEAFKAQGRKRPVKVVVV